MTEWIVKLLQDLNVKCNLLICVRRDSTAVEQLASNQGIHTTSKHIVIRCENVRDAVNHKVVKLEHRTSTENNICIHKEPES